MAVNILIERSDINMHLLATIILAATVPFFVFLLAYYGEPVDGMVIWLACAFIALSCGGSIASYFYTFLDRKIRATRESESDQYKADRLKAIAEAIRANEELAEARKTPIALDEMPNEISEAEGRNYTMNEIVACPTTGKVFICDPDYVTFREVVGIDARENIMSYQREVSLVPIRGDSVMWPSHEWREVIIKTQHPST